MGDFARGVIAEETRVINALYNKIVNNLNNGDAVNQFVGEVGYLYPNFNARLFIERKRENESDGDSSRHSQLFYMGDD